MAKLKIELVTPERRLLAAEADEVIIPGSEGLFGVRPGHAPFLALMDPGPLTVREGSGSQVFFVAGGFAKIEHDQVLVLADQAEAAQGIDKKDSSNRLQAAQEKLKGLATDVPEFESESAIVKTEMARLAIAQN